MRPKNFKQATKVLRKPSTMSDDECSSLPVWSDGKQCVSCWQPNIRERLNILFGGKVWLGVLSGKSQPPVFVAGEIVFQKTPISAQIKAFAYSVKEHTTELAKTVWGYLKEPDKRKHLIIGFLISLLIGIWAGALLGFIVGCIAGAIKEWWDSKGHGTVELMDFVFTAAGAFLAMPWAQIIHNLIW